MLFIISLFTVVVAIVYLNNIDEKDGDTVEMLKWLLTCILTINISFSLVVCATSRCGKKFTELHGLSIFTPSIACLILVYFTPIFESTPALRTTINETIFIIYLLVANFMSIDYLWHLLTRLFFCITVGGM